MTLRQRQPRIENPAFLAFVRQQRCCVCNATPQSQAAHIRMGSVEHGKRSTGAAEKASDQWCVPLCARCHTGPAGQHTMGERQFWDRIGVDPFAVALSLYSRFVTLSPETSPKPPRNRQARHKTAGQPKNGRSSKNRQVRATRPKRKWPAKAWPKGRKIANRSTFI